MFQRFSICTIGLSFLAAITGLAGCDSLGEPSRSVGQSPGDFTSTRIANIDVAAVRPVAQQALRQHFRLDTEASTGVVLRARPLEISGHHAEGEAPRVSEVISGRSGRRRELAEIHLVPSGPDVIVRAQVVVQRLDTEERAAFAQQRGGDDRPGDVTPLDRATASPAQTNREWHNAGRNRQLEKQMLDQIAEQLQEPASAPAQ